MKAQFEKRKKIRITAQKYCRNIAKIQSTRSFAWNEISSMGFEFVTVHKDS